MELDKLISEAIDELQSIILSEKYLVTIKKKIADQEEIVFILKKRVDKELQDIELLQTKPRRQLFKNILGNNKEQLEIEKQEYLHAVLMLKDATELLVPLNFEKQILLEKIALRNTKEQHLERLLLKRERELLKKGSKSGSALLEIYNTIDLINKLKKEIFEAKDIGLKCKRMATEIIGIFKKASEVRNWGQLEDLEPNHKIEKGLVDVATKKFQQLTIGLLKFEEELEDVHENQKFYLSTNTIKFNIFIESYNNYLINDWIVRNKLSSIISLLEALLDDIIRLLNTLQQKTNANKARLEEMEFHKIKLLNLR